MRSAAIAFLLLFAAVVHSQDDLDTVSSEDGQDEDYGGGWSGGIWSFLNWFWAILSAGGGGSPNPNPEPEEVLVPADDCEPCSCGIPNVKTRIVGGVETKVNQYPWMAMLMYEKQFYCGASLISDKYLLTASHCLKGFDHRKITVRLMEHDRTSHSESKIIERKVKRVRMHGRYDTTNFNNDIALIKLDMPVELEGSMRPVCLPTLGRSFSGETGLVTGWGVTRPGGSPAERLREVMVPIMSNKQCKKTAYGYRRITENMMCAGYPEGKKDSCQGDSGGPLHIVNKSVYQVAGVVSWGEGCAQANYPGVYARVNRYVTWIKNHTIDSCFCQ